MAKKLKTTSLLGMERATAWGLLWVFRVSLIYFDT